MDLKEIGLEGVQWVHLDRDQWQALVSMIMNLQIPDKVGNSLTN
jgi:hypothetical protein